MFNRFCFGALLIACLIVPLTSCNINPSGLTTIVISPTTVTVTLAPAGYQQGQSQFTATGYYGHAGKQTTQDITDQVTWSSSLTQVATINSSGLATATGYNPATGEGWTGVTNITASAPGYNGNIVSNPATFTVTACTSCTNTTTGTVSTLAVIPSAQSVLAPGDTSQFKVIGTTSTGATQNLTANANLAWSSSASSVGVFCTAAAAPSPTCTAADVGPGLITGIGQGQSTITAIYTDPTTNNVALGTATFTVTTGGGAAQSITAISIIPSSQSLSDSGQEGNFVAIGTTSTGFSLDLTTTVDWSSIVPSIATVSTAGNQTSTCNTATPPVCTPDNEGVVTGKSPGSTNITAEYVNTATIPNSVVEATPASVTVTNTPAAEPLVSLTIIPGSLTVGNLEDTGNFLAIGTFSTAPYVRDLTNSVTWLSSFPNSFPVNTNSGGTSGATAGIVTAYGTGGTTIIAEAISGGSIQTATASFSCPLVIPCPCPTCTPPVLIGSCPNGPVAGSCYPGSEASALLSTVTIYNQGLNTTNWEVTAPSATGTQNVIHCGPGWTLNGGAGGSVCVAVYPIGTPFVLTAPAGAGAFGGWSSNCTPVVSPTNLTPTTITAGGPNYCELNPTTSSETVGAIFN